MSGIEFKHSILLVDTGDGMRDWKSEMYERTIQSRRVVTKEEWKDRIRLMKKSNRADWDTRG